MTGLFGGAFDPIHDAHLTVAREARDRIGLDRIVFIPSGIPPHKSLRAPFEHRLAMARLACAELGFEACFLSGLKKLDEYTEPHRPFKILYASVYADVRPSFIVDITAQFERRMTALLSYTSQYGEMFEGGALFPNEQEIRERLAAVARFYGNQIGVKYGEPFVVKEAMQIDDIVSMPSRSI